MTTTPPEGTLTRTSKVRSILSWTYVSVTPILATLKALGLTHVPWWVVVAPIAGPCAAIVGAAVIVGLCAAYVAIKDSLRDAL